jgi:hypothetical protein
MTAPDSHTSVPAPDKWQEKYRDFFANPAMLGVSGVLSNHYPAHPCLWCYPASKWSGRWSDTQAAGVSGHRKPR